MVGMCLPTGECQCYSGYTNPDCGACAPTFFEVANDAWGADAIECSVTDSKTMGGSRKSGASVTSDDKINPIVVALIVGGAVLMCLLAGAVFFYIRQRRRDSENELNYVDPEDRDSVVTVRSNPLAYPDVQLHSVASSVSDDSKTKHMV
jgi:hypothetical protein